MFSPRFYLLPAPSLMSLKSVLDPERPEGEPLPGSMRPSPVIVNEVTFPVGVARKDELLPGRKG